ncbi:MAG: hypothetical protein WAQ28_09955 [Bacteroidia bacterium]|jgi:hypothetical protein
MEYIIKIGIEAQNKPKAEEIAMDLMSIRNALSDADLKELRTLLEKNPGIVQTAKKFLGKS